MYTTKRAFTLIELLISISVISMLASIIIATTTSAQAKGRDAKRVQQVRQIDLATRLYVDTFGHAPYLDDDCYIQSSIPNSPVGCVAVSTAVDGTQEKQAWYHFVNELKSAGFISDIPDDPCDSDCESLSGFPIGYTYVAPLAMQYYCDSNGCVATDDSYQMYAALEQDDEPHGNSGSSGSYFAAVPPGPSVSVPRNLAVTFLYEGEPNNTIATDAMLSWSPSVTTYEGASLKYYYLYKYIDGVYSLKTKLLPNPTITNTLYYWSGQYGLNETGTCWSVTAEDTDSHVSDYSVPKCAIEGEWPEPYFDGTWRW